MRLNFKEAATANYRRIVRAMLTPRPEKRAFVDEITLDSWVTIHRFADCDVEEIEIPLAVRPPDAHRLHARKRRSGSRQRSFKRMTEKVKFHVLK